MNIAQLISEADKKKRERWAALLREGRVRVLTFMRETGRKRLSPTQFYRLMHDYK